MSDLHHLGAAELARRVRSRDLSAEEVTRAHLERLNQVADNIAGRTICALGDAAALPVKSFIKHYRDEFAYHIEQKRCLVDEPAYA